MRTQSIVIATFLLTGCGLLNRNSIDPAPSDIDASPRLKTEQPPIPNHVYVLEEGDDVIGEIQVVWAAYEDTFVDIARAYGLGFDELVAANPGVDPWLPGAGTPIVLPTRFVLPEAVRAGIVLNVATKRLFYFPESEAAGATVVETYPIGIGRAGWQTPTGDTTVISKARDPVWFVPKSVRAEHLAAGDPLPRRVPPGPDNPLGKYVLGLGIPGYLIHGTNKPAGIGMRVSHGCVRLYPENIERLFQQVDIGTPVRIVNQPFLFGWQNGDLVLEAHKPLDEDSRDWYAGLWIQVRASMGDYTGGNVIIDESRIQNIATEKRGFPISVFTRGVDSVTQVRHARQVFNIITYDQVATRTAD